MHSFEGDTRAAPVFGEPDRPSPARTEPTDQPVAAQFLAFFHALSLPGPSPICGHPRGAAPASSPNLTGKTRCQSTMWPELYTLERAC